MRVLFTSIAFAATIATPALARDNDARTFSRDGVTYTYTSSEQNGATVLQGTAQPGDRDFRFVVRGKHVRGIANGQSVSFDYTPADTQIAAR
jgi:hypothetical protein